MATDLPGPGEGDALVLEDIPEAVSWVVEKLSAAGHAAHLVGGCVRDLLRGATPGDFDVTTSATPDEVLGLFPRAVPIGLRHGTVMVPTAAGQVDVTRYRAAGSIDDDLAHRDFTLNAMAYDPLGRRLLDPFEGRADLTKGLLRAVGSASERFAEDPLRALRAARLHATLELEVDPEVERAMEEAGRPLKRVARERVRRELVLIVLAPGAERGLALLRRSGLERQLAPHAAEDAAAVVAALPADLELRLAAWLRGARAVSILRRLRFSRSSVQRVERLLRLHPVETGVATEREASVRRLLKQAGDDFDALVTLRRIELERGKPASGADAGAALERLAELEEVVMRLRQAGSLALHRADLAIDGAEVMELLELPPGRAVGEALRHLTERILDDPAQNQPERLRTLLRSWARERAGEGTS